MFKEKKAQNKGEKIPNQIVMGENKTKQSKTLFRKCLSPNSPHRGKTTSLAGLIYQTFNCCEFPSLCPTSFFSFVVELISLTSVISLIPVNVKFIWISNLDLFPEFLTCQLNLSWNPSNSTNLELTWICALNVILFQFSLPILKHLTHMTTTLLWNLWNIFNYSCFLMTQSKKPNHTKQTLGLPIFSPSLLFLPSVQDTDWSSQN